MSFNEIKRFIKNTNTQYEITTSFIKEFDKSYTPEYMITRSYYYNEPRREKVIKDNHRLNDVINDMFNPRGSSNYHISINHFIERHKRKLEFNKLEKVLNTITNEYEWDGEKEIKEGAFHIHTLVSSIDESVIEYPNRNIRKALPKIIDADNLSSQFIEEVGVNDIIMDLMEYTLEERCNFIGNGSKGINIVTADPRKSYNGFYGWKGLVAYCCKTMKDADSILEVWDYENNDLTK